MILNIQRIDIVIQLLVMLQITTTYATASTATNFDNNTTYPYHYTPYDRTVTANVPSVGNLFNKFRLENQFEIGNDFVLNNIIN